jgi:hypothetical protein
MLLAIDFMLIAFLLVRRLGFIQILLHNSYIVDCCSKLVGALYEVLASVCRKPNWRERLHTTYLPTQATPQHPVGTVL